MSEPPRPPTSFSSTLTPRSIPLSAKQSPIVFEHLRWSPSLWNIRSPITIKQLLPYTKSKVIGSVVNRYQSRQSKMIVRRALLVAIIFDFVQPQQDPIEALLPIVLNIGHDQWYIIQLTILPHDQQYTILRVDLYNMKARS